MLQNQRKWDIHTLSPMEPPQEYRELHSLERVLQDHQELLPAIIDAIPVPISISHLRDDRILYGNQAFCQTFRVPGDAGCQYDLSAFYCDLECYHELRRQFAIHHLLDHTDIALQRIDGSTFRANISFRTITLNHDSVLVTTFTEITPQKHAQETLTRQALTFEKMTDAVFFLDLNHRIIDWNPAAETIFGYTQTEVLYQSFSLLYQPQTSVLLSQLILNHLSIQGRWQGETQIICKQGQICWDSN